MSFACSHGYGGLIKASRTAPCQLLPLLFSPPAHVRETSIVLSAGGRRGITGRFSRHAPVAGWLPDSRGPSPAAASPSGRRIASGNSTKSLKEDEEIWAICTYTSTCRWPAVRPCTLEQHRLSVHCAASGRKEGGGRWQGHGMGICVSVRRSGRTCKLTAHGSFCS
ncbi:hypothetical protein MPTK1_5g04750 [Marchantia polymorpha subsp. ruderalis]|uniref:Uncharacterized protein n=2 Tax=Marchantia polymorpha TaxID=3197 RepID=A0AAF6BEZ8_MARPO|nr:hypothetical protein MARPO_0027s0152 [Marchantia polymorpha]BBN10582.1 hypothetical protein Mp_5g04750 [Marchantia polymorpha subsp. ruderalis]|eukprot:PTQ43053.1 hypothetical protein MARPO_0027s0152 [Marchantia polymorpha]